MVAVGEAAGLLGEAAFYALEGEVRAGFGLALLRGLALLPRVEERGRFLALSRLVADNPDLVGLGLLENTALRLLRGLGEVWAGGVTLVDAGGAEYTGRGVRGLRVDVLSTGERFPFLAYNRGMPSGRAHEALNLAALGGLALAHLAAGALRRTPGPGPSASPTWRALTSSPPTWTWRSGG